MAAYGLIDLDPRLNNGELWAFPCYAEACLARNRPSVFTAGTMLLLLSFQTFGASCEAIRASSFPYLNTKGIIYSDISTSPLYVLNGIWPAVSGAPSKEDVIGGVSVIIWSLTLIRRLKYVSILLRFGSADGSSTKTLR